MLDESDRELLDVVKSEAKERAEEIYKFLGMHTDQEKEERSDESAAIDLLALTLAATASVHPIPLDAVGPLLLDKACSLRKERIGA